MTLGRLPDNDVVVNEPGVSRNHAEIVSTDAGFHVRDLNSTNGTFVNQDKVGTSEHLLRDGDRIRLANCDVSFLFRHNSAVTLQVTLVDMPTEEGPSDMRAVAQELESAAEAVAASQAPEEATYEGNVRLKVESEGDLQHLVQFVQELRQKPQFRLLRLVSDSQNSVDILLGLREPLELRSMLAEMEGVSQVDQEEDASGASDLRDEGSGEGRERQLNVRLGGGT